MIPRLKTTYQKEIVQTKNTLSLKIKMKCQKLKRLF